MHSSGCVPNRDYYCLLTYRISRRPRPGSRPRRGFVFGDRIIVVYGAGHSYWLRNLVKQMPGYKLVEATDYLPR